jgi:hypothetical protein
MSVLLEQSDLNPAPYKHCSFITLIYRITLFKVDCSIRILFLKITHLHDHCFRRLVIPRFTQDYPAGIPNPILEE